MAAPKAFSALLAVCMVLGLVSQIQAATVGVGTGAGTLNYTCQSKGKFCTCAGGENSEDCQTMRDEVCREHTTFDDPVKKKHLYCPGHGAPGTCECSWNKRVFNKSPRGAFQNPAGGVIAPSTNK